MTLFNFTLTLSGVTSETDGLEDALFSHGCDDALICFYGKSVYLEFDRESEMLDTAIESAINDIESSEIGAKVASVDSALVGLSDIAELSGLTRQSVAMLKDGTRGKGYFPCPIQRIKGQSPLWDWADVSRWLGENKRLSHDAELINNAKILCKWNLVLRACAYDDTQELLGAIEKIRQRRSENFSSSNQMASR